MRAWYRNTAKVDDKEELILFSLPVVISISVHILFIKKEQYHYSLDHNTETFLGDLSV